MDGTFGGGDLISASLAIMLGGNGDAELHDKEVSLTTSQITGSQTAVFEYDPEDEDPQGTPPGPWDGYSLFTIDLSGVKDDIEDLQQQVSDLEDELETCHDCWEEVVAALQQYDPTYDPDEGECPADEVPVVYRIGVNVGIASVTLDTKTITQNGTYPASAESPPLDGFSSVTVDVSPNVGSKFITQNGTYLASSDSLDGYDTVVVDVQSCGYVFPTGTDPIDPDFIDIIGMGKITDTDTDKQVTLYAKVEQYTSGDPEPKGNAAITAEFKGSAYLDEDSQGAVNPMVQIDGLDYLISSGDVISYSHPAYNGQKETGIQYRIDSWDKTTGTIVLRYRTYYAYYSDGVEYSSWSGWDYTKTATIQQLAGYGDTTHTYRANN